ncbi:MAG: NFACT RNA binding domain-containing protein [Pyramidobacter sp.]|jgi:predicted ribosome quality control (RQC) complex YloA/Tae2 family protein
MNYGPELVSALVPELESYRGCQLQRIESGSNWCAMAFKNQNPLFFTWNPEIFGICAISSDEMRVLRSGGVKTPFAMGLLRHFGGSSLTGVDCVEGDRILRLRFQRFVGAGVSREMTLILELTGRMSNALFTDEAGVIVEAAKHVYPDVNRYRTVVPGAPYVPPPPIHGTAPRPDMTDDELCACLRAPRGLGRVAAGELLRLCEGGLADLARKALFGRPTVFQKIGSYLTALGAALPGAQVFEGGGLSFCHSSIAGETERRELAAIAANALKVLERERGRKAKHADGLRNQILRAENCDSYRAAGEALLQNLGKVKGYQSSLTLSYWDEGGEKTVEVKVDPALSLRANAQAYFKKYRKYNADVEQVKIQLEGLREEINDILSLESRLKRVQSSDKLRELYGQIKEQYAESRKIRQTPPRKAKKTPPPHLRFTLGNSVILVGMNARGNRYVTFQEASPDDLWFHVHEFPGSHVILKNPPNDAAQLQRAVKAAASLALCYSDCTDSTSVVDYTEKKQVRHIAGAGIANVTYKRPLTVPVGPDDWREILRG